jgi:phytoene dehydrogenase-like protein
MTHTQPNSFPAHYDAIIVGGGHNGLVAAAYLARAGLSVLVLERQPHTGGAAVSERVFAGMDARLSRYSYLVSMFPQKIISDLGLNFESRRRAVASFAPVVRDGKHRALLISYTSPEDTAASFRALTGGDEEYKAYRRFYDLVGQFAERVWPTMLEPLLTREQMKQRFMGKDEIEAWDMFVEKPLGESIERAFRDDDVRGAVFTDAKIGILTYPHDPSMLQNRTFIYHVVGGGTGEWRVPVGGMGALTGALADTARSAGAEIITSASVERIVPGQPAEVEFVHDEKPHTVQARFVLANVAPSVLATMLPDGHESTNGVEGAAFKINMLLTRLPKLKASGYRPEQAFSGTFHLDEGYQAMEESYRSAIRGQIPDRPPAEMYCHSLTDSSILSPGLAAAGYQTITLFGLDMPYRLFHDDNERVRREVLRRYLAAINQYLAEPLEDCLAQDADGKPCIEAKSAVDLESELNMPAGHIFHNDCTWPFTDDEAQAGQWGVETHYPNLFICGSGVQRGGCVSGIPGHNAAMKVLSCV